MAYQTSEAHILTHTFTFQIMTFSINTPKDVEILEVNSVYFIKSYTDTLGRLCADLVRRMPKGKYRKEKRVDARWFQSEDRRFAWFIKQVNNILSDDRVMKTRKISAKVAQKEAAKSGLVKVGDIFTASWGYDQTNVDFYEVISISGSAVKLKSLRQDIVNDGRNSCNCVAIPGKYYSEEVLSHRVNFKHGGPLIKVSSSQWARPWDGKPKYFSHN